MSQVAVPTKVVVHPLVLLSVVDHYNRVAKDTKNRVAGVLLGEISGGVVDITNSFAGNYSKQCFNQNSTFRRRSKRFFYLVFRSQLFGGYVCDV